MCTDKVLMSDWLWNKAMTPDGVEAVGCTIGKRHCYYVLGSPAGAHLFVIVS